MLHILLELDKYQSDNAWYIWILGLTLITPLHHGFAAHRLGTAELDMFLCVTQTSRSRGATVTRRHILGISENSFDMANVYNCNTSW